MQTTMQDILAQMAADLKEGREQTRERLLAEGVDPREVSVLLRYAEGMHAEQVRHAEQKILQTLVADLPSETRMIH